MSRNWTVDLRHLNRPLYQYTNRSTKYQSLHKAMALPMYQKWPTVICGPVSNDRKVRITAMMNRLDLIKLQNALKWKMLRQINNSTDSMDWVVALWANCKVVSLSPIPGKLPENRNRKHYNLLRTDQLVVSFYLPNCIDKNSSKSLIGLSIEAKICKMFKVKCKHWSTR